MKNIKQFIKENAVDEGFLQDWYQASITNDTPVWTDEHISEIYDDFYLIPKEVVDKKIENKETILQEALTYMASMHGLRLSKFKTDDYIEYSCNGYRINKKTYEVLQKAKRIIDFWE